MFVKKNKNKIRVVVAMSGGVDSSVAAALLKKQGYDVVGVFMRFWSETRNLTDSYTDKNGFNSPQPSLKIREGENTNTCCSEGAEQAARDVATKLGIPFYILSAQKEFKKAVVDYFLAQQKRGLTPNPCVMCNKKIKFGLLFEKALAMGADFIATGHYARLWREIRNSKSEIRNKSKNQNLKTYKLHRAKDQDKDQSYFLYTLTQKQLSRILFPLADFTKDEVYKMAKKWKLPYRKDESFDLCFVANDVGGFLKRHLKMRKGKILNYNFPPPPLSIKGGAVPLLREGGVRGELLGMHQGLAHYTIGQRKRVPVQNGPWWVIKKDEKKNILYVTNNEEDLYSREIFATGVNWLNGVAPKLPATAWAKIRYRSEAAESQIANSKSHIAVKFKKPQRAVTPGQSVVFYSKDGELLGGGVIKN